MPSNYFTPAVAFALVLGATSAFAQDAGALVDALVKKGILSDQEAEEIRADMTKDFATTSAGKINLSNSVTELKLYGDLRLRYQYDNRDSQLDPAPVGTDGDRSPSGSQRSRYRFRLRLNADFRLTENFFGGVELQTAQASDSANQTFEDGFDDYNIYISKAFIGYNVTPWATVIGGKFANPFYTTDLVYDADINPTGLTESIAFHKIRWGGGGGAETSYSKDGKSVSSGGDDVWVEPNWELTLNAGQFIFDDNLEGAGPDNDLSTDAFLFHTQLVAGYKFANSSKLTIAPGWMTYINGSVGGLRNENSFNDRDNPADDASRSRFADVSGASRNLNILLLPGDYSFKIGSLKTKLLWDFAYNLEGRKRVEDIYNMVSLRTPGVGEATDSDDINSQHSDQDNYAYMIGVLFGENKKKGDWSVLANWRQTGLGAVDPNLNDSDFALGELNTRGTKLSVAYNFTDFGVGAVTWYHAWNLRDTLVGGEATGGNAIADANAADLLQVDFSFKF
jgi:hypothetical protein